MNRNYDWKEFDSIHKNAIAAISKATACDMGVARDKLIDMADKQDAMLYDGLPGGYDLALVARDVKELRDQFE